MPATDGKQGEEGGFKKPHTPKDRLKEKAKERIREKMKEKAKSPLTEEFDNVQPADNSLQGDREEESKEKTVDAPSEETIAAFKVCWKSDV